MIPTTSQRVVSSMGRRLATTQSVRRLSHATMGFEQIAEWKEYRRRVSNPSYSSKTETIFDLKVYTPTNKSSTWNISYASKEVIPSQRSLSPPPLPSPKRFRVHSRHFAAAAATQPIITNLTKIDSPIRLSAAANMFSSLATETKLADSNPSSIFGSERGGAEITDVPGPDMSWSGSEPRSSPRLDQSHKLRDSLSTTMVSQPLSSTNPAICVYPAQKS